MNPIVTKNLSVSYDNCSILKNLNLEVQEGELVVIVGKSGSGKTTLLYALAHLIPFSGEVIIPKNLDLIFQQQATFPWLTVSENIAFGLKEQDKEKREQIIEEYLILAGLEDKKDRYPAELSGGEVQRVALARSLVHHPEVLLMDEPYGALDAYTRDRMQRWLLDVWATHQKTIIFITHDIEEAIFLADRIFVLDNQRFVKEYKIPFERPRKEHLKFSPEFNQLRLEIVKSLNQNSH